jgi:hypothetical protein
MNFDKFLLASKMPMTPLQKLQYKASSLTRWIENLKDRKYESTSGVYGTASTEYSEDQFRILQMTQQLSLIEKEIEQIIQNSSCQAAENPV